MRVLTEENHDLPLCRTMVMVRRGAAGDLPTRSGLSNFAIELMARGADGMARAELDRALDALGGSLEAVADHDAVYFETTVLRPNLEKALALVSAVLLRPDFVAEESERLLRELAGQLDDLRDDDQGLARRYLQRELFADHPYGRSLLGTKQTIAALDAAAARAWHADVVKGDRVIIGFAGDLGASEAQALAEKYFGALPTGGEVPSPPPPPTANRGRRLLLIDKPERTQSQIYLAQTAPGWTHRDYFPLLIATTVFGGTFTARLMNEVRSKRGLSYGASARILNGRGEKALLAHVFPSLEQTCETLELVERLWLEWVKDGITEAELDFAKGYLAESFAFSLATPEERLDLRVSVENCGLQSDFAHAYPDRVRAVTLGEVKRAMAEHLRPRDLQIAITSTAEELVPRLEAAGLAEGLRVVPFDEY